MPSHCSATSASRPARAAVSTDRMVRPSSSGSSSRSACAATTCPASRIWNPVPSASSDSMSSLRWLASPASCLVLLVPDGGPGHRGPRRAGQRSRPVPENAHAAAPRGLPGRVDVIPAHRDLVGRAAGADTQHGQVGGVPLPRLGDLDAAGLVPAERGQHELRLGVGVARQPELPGFPADGVPALAARHQRLARREGREPRPVRRILVTTGTSSGAAAWRGPRPTGRRPAPRPSPWAGSAAAPAGAGSRSPGRPGGSGPGGRRATGRRCP